MHPRKRHLGVLASVLLISACSLRTEQSQANKNQPPVAQAKSVVLAKQENPKYKLTAVFYGLDTADKLGAPTFDHIAIRDDVTGDEFVYEPKEREPFDEKNNIRNVWSPDGEFLLLMRGNSAGVCIIKASEAEKDIKSHSCSDFIMVYPKGSEITGLMHSYGIWASSDEFHFSAGLSGDNWNFIYNVKTRKLTSTGSARNFEGENRYGKVSLDVR